MNYYLKKYKPSIYANGNTLPLYRGVLHQCISIIMPILIIFYYKKLSENWSILIFLNGKLFSYSISAILHTGFSRKKQSHNLCLLLDKIGVYISVFVTGIPFMQYDNHFKNQSEIQLYDLKSDILIYYSVNSIILICGINYLIIGYEKMRIYFFIIQFIFDIRFIGYQVDWNILWVMGLISYGSCFIVFLPCILTSSNDHTSDKYLLVKWHKKGYYGCHEDFHLLLLLSDIIFFINAMQYVNK